jgi:hypothetical protein
MVQLQPHFLDASFNAVAAGFNWASLIGSQGETGGTTAGWGFDNGQNLAYRYGQAHAFVADMHRAFYASRGKTYTRWAFVAQDAGNRGTSYNSYTQILLNTVGAIVPGFLDDGVVRGSTGDRLALYDWSGSTGTTQDNVLGMSIYSNDGINRFKTFCDNMFAGYDYERGNRPNITTPSILAYDNEDIWNTGTPVWFYNPDNTYNASSSDYGAFLQNLNDARRSSYLFFDRYTLDQIWGATGGTSTAFRSTYQKGYAFTFTGPNNLGSITVTAAPYIDVIYDQRANSINYAPAYTSFLSSFLKRHRQHLFSKAWQTWHNENVLIGNYQDVASTRLYPSRSAGKFPQITYSCDVACTGPNSENGFTSASVTGTFPLDYSSPVLYGRNPNGVANFYPSFGTTSASQFRNYYSGEYNNSTVVRMGATGGLYSQGINAPDVNYVSFLQRIGSVGVTATQGGGTAQGYTGANITDMLSYWYNFSKQDVDNARSALNQYTDNANKPIVPWVGSIGFTYRNIFSDGITDSNGLTSFSIQSYGLDVLQHNVDIIKYCIKTHSITDFLIFESGFDRTNASTSGITAADFWLDVIESLIADSASQSANTNTNFSGSSINGGSGFYYLGGRLYTREQYEQILRTFYPNTLR